MAQPVSQGGIDYPDGGMPSRGGVYPLTGDLGELAVRLLSPVSFNREGNVVFIETFAYGLGGWTVGGDAADYEVYISNDNFRSLGYSCKLICSTKGERITYIQRRIPCPSFGRVGLELAAHFHGNLDYFWVDLSHIQHDTWYTFGWMLDRLDGLLYLRDTDGTWLDLSTEIDTKQSYEDFDIFKLVADFDGHNYDRLIYNTQEINLTGYGGYPVADWGEPHALIEIRAKGNAAGAGPCWVDDVILTINEPEHA